MTLKHSLSFIFCLAFTTIAAWAQSNKFSNSIFRFATRAEGQTQLGRRVTSFQTPSSALPLVPKDKC